MHASLPDLLSLRDAAPVDAHVAQHVKTCAHCTRELGRLGSVRQQLQKLPQVDAPAEAWSRIQHSLMLPPPVRAARRWLAGAAAVAVVAVIAGVLVRGTDRPITASAPEPQSGVRAEAVALLVERSQELERVLQALPERPRIERVSTAATIDALEQRIQWLDFQLSYAPDESLDAAQAQRLWRERVELMDSLVKVRYAEAGRTSF